jgi:hypothetical protein
MEFLRREAIIGTSFFYSKNGEISSPDHPRRFRFKIFGPSVWGFDSAEKP